MQLLTFACLMLGLGSATASKPRTHIRAHHNEATADDVDTISPCQSIQTLRYVSSDWEKDWSAAAASLSQQNGVCSRMKQDGDNIAVWLQQIKDNEPSEYVSELSTSVFSFFDRVCHTLDGQTIQLRQYVEPLVGHMRHPLGIPSCVPEGKQPVSVEDRQYILHSGVDVRLLSTMYPGRKYLIDAGTRDFGSSLSYMLTAYKKLGVHFDEIYAFELTPYNHSAYWESVPKDVLPRLHLYNAPIDATPGSKFNPLEIIRHIYRPGDFVVFKLDVDAEAIETAIIEQILADGQMPSIISEMFYEKHYNSRDMDPWFAAYHFQSDFSEALHDMQRMRQHGLHIHYWP